MPIKTDAAGQIYYDGDNIRITEKDLAWIRRPKALTLPTVDSIRPSILPRKAK